MSLRRVLYSTVAAIELAALAAAVLSPADAQQAATVAIDDDDIGGVVTSTNGPEAGAARPVHVGRRSLDAPNHLRSGWRDDDEPPCRPARRHTLQIFRRLD